MKSIESLLSPRGRGSRGGRRALPARPARSPLRRARLDRAPPRRALRVGVRLARKVRRPGRARRRGLSLLPRPEAGALLGRRARRRDRRLDHAREVLRARRQAAAPARRALGPRSRRRAPPRRGVRRIRPRGRLYEGRARTNPELHAARAIYEKTGFRLVRTETTRVFGAPQKAQTWELPLDRA